jgi:hypothetical protein
LGKSKTLFFIVVIVVVVIVGSHCLRTAKRGDHGGDHLAEGEVVVFVRGIIVVLVSRSIRINVASRWVRRRVVWFQL